MGVAVRGLVSALVACLVASLALSAAPQKSGKLLIRSAPPDASGFANAILDDTVRDLKKNRKSFAIVEKEDEADFLIVVVDRTEQGADKRIVLTLSVRDGSGWKPGTKIEQHHGFWGRAADLAMGQAEKWVKVYRTK